MLFEALLVTTGLVVAGAMVAGAITSFTNTARDIYAELKAAAEMHEKNGAAQ